MMIYSRANTLLFSTILAFAVAACGQQESTEPAAATAVEGTEAVEEWIGPKDVAGISEALREIHPAEELERRLTSSRRIAERNGALRGLFFRDPQRRARALATARQDPSKRVRAVGSRLEEVLQVWMLDPGAERYLGEAPVVRLKTSKQTRA